MYEQNSFFYKYFLQNVCRDEHFVKDKIVKTYVCTCEGVYFRKMPAKIRLPSSDGISCPPNARQMPANARQCPPEHRQLPARTHK